MRTRREANPAGHDGERRDTSGFRDVSPTPEPVPDPAGYSGGDPWRGGPDRGTARGRCDRRHPTDTDHRSAVTSLAEQTTLLSALPDEAGAIGVISGVRVNTSRRLWSAEQPGLPATGLAGGPPPDPGVAVRSSPRGFSQPTQCLGAVQPAATARPHECQRGGGRCRHHPVRRRTFDRWRNGLRAPRCGRRVPQPDHSDRAPRPPLTPHQPAAGTTPSIDGQLATQEPAPEPVQSAWWFDHCLRSRGGSSRHLMHNPDYPPLVGRSPRVCCRGSGWGPSRESTAARTAW